MRSRGDTLIEVMIAMAIISSVLAVSYTTASRALNMGQQAQERVEALKLVEGQIETLKYAAGLDGTTVYSAGDSFCLDASGVVQAQNAVPDDLFTDTLNSAAAASGIPVSGEIYNTKCSVGTSGRYKLSIVRQDSGAAPSLRSTFLVRARWERLGGGIDEVAIYYKLHQGLYQ